MGLFHVKCWFDPDPEAEIAIFTLLLLPPGAGRVKRANLL